MTGQAHPAPARLDLVSLRRFAFPAALAATFAAFGLLLVWNAFHYDWLRSYDAYHSSLYVDVVHDQHRLPKETETDVWHNPPLFFAVAGQVQAVAEAVGWPDEPRRAVQLFDVLCALGVAAFALLTARELWPRSRPAQLGTLGLAALTPVLGRAAVQYHPEPLAAVLTAGAVFVVVRAFARERLSWQAGLAAGALIGLANLTRTWALAAFGALVLPLALRAVLRRERPAALMLGALAAVTAALTIPWFAYKWSEHGSPLAYSQPVAEQWKENGRPSEFWFGLALDDVFTQPYQPRNINQLFPVVYSDWWGDFWRNYRMPLELQNEPERLPDEYHDPLVLQSYAGVVPSLLMIAGVIGLAVIAVRRRSYPLLVVLGSLALLVLSFVGFIVQYPKQDGDNMKALYLLTAAAPLSICGGWALARVLDGSRLLAGGALLLLAAVAYLDVTFLLLPA